MSFKRILEVRNVICITKTLRQRVPEAGGNVKKGPHHLKVARRVSGEQNPFCPTSGVSVKQSVGSNPGHDTCVPEQDTLL